MDALTVITFIYTVFTAIICYFNLRSARAVEKSLMQVKINNLPCIVEKEIHSYGTGVFANTRRQLQIKILLENIGDFPALNLFVIGYIELKYTTNKGSRVVNMTFAPDILPYISQGQNETMSVQFEAKEIFLLVEDLKICHNLNVERIKNAPHNKSFDGSNLVLEVYYKNLLGQWFKLKIVHIVSWLINTSKNAPINTTRNINENTIPPKELCRDTSFTLQLVSDRFSSQTVSLIDIVEVKDALEKYKNDIPYAHAAIEQELLPNQPYCKK